MVGGKHGNSYTNEEYCYQYPSSVIIILEWNAMTVCSTVFEWIRPWVERLPYSWTMSIMPGWGHSFQNQQPHELNSLHGIVALMMDLNFLIFLRYQGHEKDTLLWQKTNKYCSIDRYVVLWFILIAQSWFYPEQQGLLKNIQGSLFFEKCFSVTKWSGKHFFRDCI